MPYRVEMASTGRAVCKETNCKKDGIKIEKGELRFGTLVTIQDHQSWSWKHWGCTTPAQIGNLKEASDGDTDMVDGYDELPADLQEKVKTALEEGHVADEDWKGDVEFNRPGKKGVRKRAPKKAAKDEEGEGEEEQSPEEKPAPKKRGRLSNASKAAEEDAPAPAKKRGRPAKAADADAPARKKAKAGKKVAAKKEEADGEDAEEVEVEAPKAKRGRPKGTTAKKPAAEKAVPQKRGRPKKVVD